MPSLGPHPKIVHFVVALLLIGVLLRWVAFTGRVTFAGPGATALLCFGTVAAVLAVSSGTAAHEAVERIPGVGAAVLDHEGWGHRTRTVFLAVADAGAPGDTAIALLHIESQLVDRHDVADAYVAAGRADSARALLRRLVVSFPMSQRLKDRLVQLGG